MAFDQMAIALQKQQNEITKAKEDLTVQRKQIDEQFDMQLSQISLAENQNKQQQNEVKFAQKDEKLNQDLLKQMLQAQPGVAVSSGQSVIPPTEQQAQGLPILDGI